MPHSIRAKVLGVGGVLGVVAATLTLAAGPAAAAVVAPKCHAPSGSGQSCVKIINHTQQINSLRESKTHRCLLNIGPGKTGYYTDVFISLADNVQLNTYTGSNCEGKTQVVNLIVRWGGPDGDNYIFTNIRNV
jgi:hypothetical protein